MTRAIITVVGKDTVGIIAKVCTYLAENQINILDISQTIVQEFFNMMMIVDMSKCDKPFDHLAEWVIRAWGAIMAGTRYTHSRIAAQFSPHRQR